MLPQMFQVTAILTPNSFTKLFFSCSKIFSRERALNFIFPQTSTSSAFEGKNDALKVRLYRACIMPLYKIELQASLKLNIQRNLYGRVQGGVTCCWPKLCFLLTSTCKATEEKLPKYQLFRKVSLITCNEMYL